MKVTPTKYLLEPTLPTQGYCSTGKYWPGLITIDKYNIIFLKVKNSLPTINDDVRYEMF